MTSKGVILPTTCDYKIVGTRVPRDPTHTDGIYDVVKKSTGEKKILKYFYSDKIGPSNPNEVAVASTLHHPNIMSIDMLLGHQYCSIKGLGEIMNVAEMSYMDYIPQLLTLESMLISMLRILHGIQFMHRQGYLHLDIKYDNVVMLNGVETVIDFGNAVPCQNVREGVNLNIGKLFGTVFYLPPEVYRSDLRSVTYNYATDVWALGHLFFAVLFKTAVHPGDLYSIDKTPEGRRQIFEISDRLTDKDYVRSIIMKYGSTVYTPSILDMLTALFVRIWSKDPSTRPSVSQIISFPLFDIVREKVPTPEGNVFSMGVILTAPQSSGIAPYLKLLLGMARSFNLGNLPLVVLMTAIDMYYRTYHSTLLVQNNPEKVRRNLAYACFYISLREHTIQDYNIYESLLQTIQEDVEYFSRMICDIYILLHGDVNRYSYYQLCSGANHVKILLLDYIFNPPNYIGSNFLKFKQEIAVIPPQGKSNMTIAEFSAYISQKK